MPADAFIQCRVTPEMKAVVRALAEREQITESALVKQLLQVVLRTAALQGFPSLEALDRPNRDARLYVRLGPEDRQLLSGKATQRGMPSATYVSLLVRAHLRGVAPLPKEELLALKHLAACEAETKSQPAVTVDSGSHGTAPLDFFQAFKAFSDSQTSWEEEHLCNSRIFQQKRANEPTGLRLFSCRNPLSFLHSGAPKDFKNFDRRDYRTVSARTGYGEWAKTYEEAVPNRLDIRVLESLRIINWSIARECLDLACDTGRTGEWLKARGVATIDGIDLTPEMLERASAKGLYRTLFLGSVEETEITLARYDLIVMSLVDEHLATLGPVYQEAYRLAPHTRNSSSSGCTHSSL
jgi:hypothetical protein